MSKCIYCCEFWFDVVRHNFPDDDHAGHDDDETMVIYLGLELGLSYLVFIERSHSFSLLCVGGEQRKYSTVLALVFSSSVIR